MAIWTLPVLIYRSVVAGRRPASLSDGQLFLNQIDGVLCWPNSNGTGSYSSTLLTSAEQFVCLNTAYTLAAQTAPQALFNASPNGAVQLSPGCYHFECEVTLSNLSTNASSFGFGFAGTASLTQNWSAFAHKSALNTPSSPQVTANSATNPALTTPSTSSTGFMRVRGVLRVTAAGTLIPQISLGVEAPAIVGVNSFLRLWSVGSATVNTVGAWS